MVTEKMGADCKNSASFFVVILFDGTQLLAQDNGNILYFNYGADGISGFSYAGVGDYTYRKNVRGDVLAIVDASGLEIVRYVYDAWGNHKVYVLDNNEYIDIDGEKGYAINNSNNKIIAELNPIRYRGYYYDAETGLYYLNSRYYDPETGRFLNADDVSYLDPDSLGGLNLYAYCLNNPVMYTDGTGTSWWTDFWNGIGGAIAKIVIGAIIVAGLTVLAVFTGGTILGVIATGAALGAGIGFGVGGITGGLGELVNGGSFLQGFANGALCGAVTGAISGAVGASPIGVLGQVGVGAALGVGGYVLGQVVSHGSITITGLVAAAGLGALGGLLGGKGYMHGSSGIWLEQTVRQVTRGILLKSLLNESIVGFLSGGFSVLDNKVFKWKRNRLYQF